MEMITLNNGVKMPIVGFGTYKVTERSECETSIIEAVKAGYRMIDTAQLYDNEEIVGSGIKKAVFLVMRFLLLLRFGLIAMRRMLAVQV